MNTYDKVTVIGLVTLTVLSVILNLFSLIMTIRKRSKVMFVRIVLGSLFISNMFQAVLGYPVRVYALVTNRNATDTECKFEGFAVFSMASTSIAHITVICIHLIVQVKRPFFARYLNEDAKVAFGSVLFSWLFGILIAIPPFYGWSRYAPDADNMFCCLDFGLRNTRAMIYVALAMTLLYVLPLLLLIASPLFRRKKTLRRRNTNELSSTRYFKVGLAMMLCFIVTWTPYAIMALLVFASVPVMPSVVLACNIIAKVSALPNSIIYSMSYKIHDSLPGICCIANLKSMRTNTNNKANCLNIKERRQIILSVDDNSALITT